MRRKFLQAVPAVLVLCQAQAPKATFYTIVREDTFAGYIGGDMERVEHGMKNAEKVLADNAQNADALGWTGGGQEFLGTRVCAQDLNGKAAGFYDGGFALKEDAIANEPR